MIRFRIYIFFFCCFSCCMAWRDGLAHSVCATARINAFFSHAACSNPTYYAHIIHICILHVFVCVSCGVGTTAIEPVEFDYYFCVEITISRIGNLHDYSFTCYFVCVWVSIPFFFDSFILILSAQMLAKISACILVTSIFSCIFFSLSLARAWEAQYSIPAVQRAPAHGEFQAKRFVIGYAFVIRSAPMANFLLLLFLCATLRFPQPLSLRLGQFYSPNIQTRETDQTRKKRRKNSIKSFYPLSLPDWCSFHYIHLRKRNSTETKNIKTSPIETRM